MGESQKKPRKEMHSESYKGMSRRGFLKATTLGGAAAFASAGLLTGCGESKSRSEKVASTGSHRGSSLATIPVKKVIGVRLASGFLGGLLLQIILLHTTKNLIAMCW